jgi:hypothetical protein
MRIVIGITVAAIGFSIAEHRRGVGSSESRN